MTTTELIATIRDSQPREHTPLCYTPDVCQCGANAYNALRSHALALCEAAESYEKQEAMDTECIERLRQEAYSERLAKEAVEAKLSKMGRLLDFAEQVNDASTEKEVALSASFQEAMAYEMLEQVESERDALLLAKEAAEKERDALIEWGKSVDAKTNKLFLSMSQQLEAALAERDAERPSKEAAKQGEDNDGMTTGEIERQAMLRTDFAKVDKALVRLQQAWERAEFERWTQGNDGSLAKGGSVYQEGSFYLSNITQYMWVAWQARALL